MGFVLFKQFNMSLKVYQLTVKDLYFLFLRLFSVVIRKLLVLSTSKQRNCERFIPALRPTGTASVMICKHVQRGASVH